MKHEPETTTDAGGSGGQRRVLAGGSLAARVMIRTPRHPRRRLLAVGACAAVLLMGERRPALTPARSGVLPQTFTFSSYRSARARLRGTRGETGLAPVP